MVERKPKTRSRRKKFPLLAIALLIALLVYPTLAMVCLSRWLGGRLIAGYFATVFLITYYVYWHDKCRAEAGGRRVPESVLHFAELIGGWPAAYIAQRAVRHKISKTAYQITFWCIVALHQAAAFDFLLDWHYTRAALSLLGVK